MRVRCSEWSKNNVPLIRRGGKCDNEDDWKYAMEEFLSEYKNGGGKNYSRILVERLK